MPDVAIVGAGPVGLALAALLSVRGVEVEVLEQRKRAGRSSRAIGIHPPGLDVLDAVGVAEAAVTLGVRIGGGFVACDGRVLGRMSFAEAGARHPFVLSLPQLQTEQLLADRLHELAPGALRHGARVDGDRVPHARIVVGADGVRSTVRAIARIRRRRHGRPRHYAMADFLDETALGASAALLFERGGVVESFPLPGGRRRWVAMTDRLWTDATAEDLAGLIADRTGSVVRGGGAVSAFTARQHLAETFARGRFVLVGDAAHELSPIGGQGMNLGWLDAAALAEAIPAALDGDAGALAGYDAARRRSAAVAIWQAAFNMAMGGPAHGVRLSARNAVVRALAVPPGRALAARAFTMRWL